MFSVFASLCLHGRQAAGNVATTIKRFSCVANNDNVSPRRKKEGVGHRNGKIESGRKAASDIEIKILALAWIAIDCSGLCQKENSFNVGNCKM